MKKLSKNQKMALYGVAGALALYLLYRWYQNRSSSVAAQQSTNPTPDTSGGGGGAPGGAPGTDVAALQAQEQADVASLQGALANVQGQLAGAPSQSDIAALQSANQSALGDVQSGIASQLASFESRIPGIVSGLIPAAPPTPSNPVVGGTNPGGSKAAGATGLPAWLKKLLHGGVTAKPSTAHGASFLVTSPSRGGNWHTYYTNAGHIVNRVFVSSSPHQTSHQQHHSVAASTHAPKKSVMAGVADVIAPAPAAVAQQNWANAAIASALVQQAAIPQEQVSALESLGQAPQVYIPPPPPPPAPTHQGHYEWVHTKNGWWRKWVP